MQPILRDFLDDILLPSLYTIRQDHLIYAHSGLFHELNSASTWMLVVRLGNSSESWQNFRKSSEFAPGMRYRYIRKNGWISCQTRIYTACKMYRDPHVLSRADLARNPINPICGARTSRRDYAYCRCSEKLLVGAHSARRGSSNGAH
jgi:hypothetical protein